MEHDCYSHVQRLVGAKGDGRKTVVNAISVFLVGDRTKAAPFPSDLHEHFSKQEEYTLVGVYDARVTREQLAQDVAFCATPC